MGREIKRVPLSFSWPLKMMWKGYINPYSSQDCNICERTGYNPQTKQIADDWYDFEHTGRRWCDKLMQDEVDALIENGRLMDFTHKYVKGRGWVAIEPTPVVTADMVNAWSQNGLRHDAINRFICIEARAERLGIWGHCEVCNGEGVIWFNDKVKELSESWYEKERYDPPTGEGWQVWETVSEGSPISPVFDSPEKCIDWLVDQGYSRQAATKFVLDEQTVFSMVMVDGNMYDDIESSVL